MPRRVFVHALAVTALCALAAGCTPHKPASPSMFFGNCITPPGRDPCSDDMAICQVYENIIEQQFATAGACRSACNQASTRLSSQNVINECGYMVDRGNDLCEQECLRLYPEQK